MLSAARGAAFRLCVFRSGLYEVENDPVELLVYLPVRGVSGFRECHERRAGHLRLQCLGNRRWGDRISLANKEQGRHVGSHDALGY